MIGVALVQTLAMNLSRKLVAEFIGTFILVFVAVGAAVTGIRFAADPDAVGGIPGSGVTGVAMAFGLVLAMLVYAFGHISGCHINPAVTIAMMTGRKMDAKQGGLYMVAQVAGAIFGAFLLWLLVNTGGVTDKTGALGSNAYDNGAVNLWGALLVEILLTFVFVLVILFVTDKYATHAALAGIAIGFALLVVHLVGIPLTGTSVNPARSIGPALFGGTEALSQLWLFIVAPLIGGVLAAIVWRGVVPDSMEDTDISLDK